MLIHCKRYTASMASSYLLSHPLRQCVVEEQEPEEERTAAPHIGTVKLLLNSENVCHFCNNKIVFQCDKQMGFHFIWKVIIQIYCIGYLKVFMLYNKLCVLYIMYNLFIL